MKIGESSLFFFFSYLFFGVNEKAAPKCPGKFISVLEALGPFEMVSDSLLKKQLQTTSGVPVIN